MLVAALHADYVVVSLGQQILVPCLITRAHLDTLYMFKGVFGGLPESALHEGQLGSW